MHALPVNLPCVKQLPVITNEAEASPHAGSTCAIGVVTVRPFNRQPAQLYFKLTPDPNNTFFFIFTCTTQYPWVLANPDLSQAMASSKQKLTHTVFRASSTHRSASTSKPRFVGECRHVKLNEICSKGKSSLRQKDVINDGPYSVYGASGVVGTTSDYQNEIPYVAVIKDGAGVGRASACEPMTSVLGTMQALIPNPNVERDYLLYLVRSLRLGEGFSGSTIPHIYFKDYGKIEVPLPSLEAQKRIVSQLGLIEAQIEQAEAQTTQLDQLVKSRFVEMFGELDTNPKGFQLTCFDDLGTWTSGGTPSRKNPSYFTGEIDWYSAGELNSLHLGRSKERISLRAIEESSAKLVPPGSLFVGMYDTAALKMGITTKESSSNQACANLVPNGIVDLVWLYFAIDQLKPSLLAKRSGCRQKNLSLKKIKSFMVPLPDLDSQQGFSRFVAQVDKSRFVRDHEMNFR